MMPKIDYYTPETLVWNNTESFYWTFTIENLGEKTNAGFSKRGRYISFPSLDEKSWIMSIASPFSNIIKPAKEVQVFSIRQFGAWVQNKSTFNKVIKYAQKVQHAGLTCTVLKIQSPFPIMGVFLDQKDQEQDPTTPPEYLYKSNLERLIKIALHNKRNDFSKNNIHEIPETILKEHQLDSHQMFLIFRQNYSREGTQVPIPQAAPTLTTEEWLDRALHEYHREAELIAYAWTQVTKLDFYQHYGNGFCQGQFNPIPHLTTAKR